MRIDLDDQPTDPELLQRLVRDLVADKERRDGEIDKLKLIIKQLQLHQFGRRSEKLEPDQLAPGFEDIEVDISRAEERQTQSKPARPDLDADGSAPLGALPKHLPRHDVMHDVGVSDCPQAERLCSPRFRLGTS